MEIDRKILINFAGAAELLSISVSGLHNLDLAGKLPAPRRLGARTLFDVDELREWSRKGCMSRLQWEMRKENNGDGD